MRSREEIKNELANYAIVELLLDIRDLLVAQNPSKLQDETKA